jgi:hypothetical protein
VLVIFLLEGVAFRGPSCCPFVAMAVQELKKTSGRKPIHSPFQSNRLYFRDEISILIPVRCPAFGQDKPTVEENP